MGNAQAQSQAPAALPTKVATIQVQTAILSTGDGKKAQNDLTNKFSARKQALENQKRRNECEKDPEGDHALGFSAVF